MAIHGATPYTPPPASQQAVETFWGEPHVVLSRGNAFRSKRKCEWTYGSGDATSLPVPFVAASVACEVQEEGQRPHPAVSRTSW